MKLGTLVMVSFSRKFLDRYMATFFKFSLLWSTVFLLTLQSGWSMDKEDSTIVSIFSTNPSYKEPNVRFNKDVFELVTEPYKAMVPPSRTTQINKKKKYKK
ncbi:MAG: hypothetical protein KBD90_00145, partial [Alphaproteobacteria bacterium]|nr:hypothetical protein [Alphaproteobacteria bacterium]